MRFDVVCSQPRLIECAFTAGVVGRAVDRGLLQVVLHDLRDHATDRHHTIDDTAFGGGPGMVIKPEPVAAAIDAARAANPGPVVLLEPWGRRFDQALARRLSAAPGLILVCGRYEGIDDRIRQLYADLEISIGDYVLSGGEPAAVVVIDVIARLVPGVVGDRRSLAEDSFSGEGEVKLGYPQFTRPVEFRGIRVPEVLMSGNHAAIQAWREAQGAARLRHRQAAVDPPDSG